MDIIQERSDNSKCPICDREIGEDFKRVLYKGKKVWICKHHPVVNEEPTPVLFKKIPEGGVA